MHNIQWTIVLSTYTNFQLTTLVVESVVTWHQQAFANLLCGPNKGSRGTNPTSGDAMFTFPCSSEQGRGWLS